MAYRRKQVLGRSSTFKDEMYRPSSDHDSTSSSSRAAPAIRASASNARREPTGGGPTYDYTSMGSSSEAGSFWGVLARKAKAILEEDNESPRSQEEGRMEVEKKSPELMRESRKPQIRRNGFNLEEQNLTSGQQSNSSLKQTSQEEQLKASRDVAMATAAKAKLLLRELKTVKAELSFAKQRNSQLEEENKILREAREKGANPADDDMIRMQLETLLEEKAWLAHENSVYARENRFLREIVEYHQLAMQDLAYLDDDAEGIEDVEAVCSMQRRRLCMSASASVSSSPRSKSPRMCLSRTSSMDLEADNPTTTATAAEAAPQDDSSSTRQS